MKGDHDEEGPHFNMDDELMKPKKELELYEKVFS